MSFWAEHDLDAKIVEVLAQVPLDDHHFGRPYLSAYQLAIAFHRRFPEVTQALDKPLGGEGTGQQDSLTQYLARELSGRIKSAGGDHMVEGAFLSSNDLSRMIFTSPDGNEVSSSLLDAGLRTSLFRLR